jgi:hypothetical protein
MKDAEYSHLAHMHRGGSGRDIAMGRPLMPPSHSDSVYNFAHRETNDNGWKFAFSTIFLATVLFGFVALSLEGAERNPGGGIQLCAAFEADIHAASTAVKQVAAVAHEKIAEANWSEDGPLVLVRRWWWSQGIHLLWSTASGALLVGAALVMAASYFPHFSVFGCTVGLSVQAESSGPIAFKPSN